MADCPLEFLANRIGDLDLETERDLDLESERAEPVCFARSS